MSVFKVKLNNVTGTSVTAYNPAGTTIEKQGNMDVNSLTGAMNTTSIQRTIYVMGPHRIMRELHDGETFTDCNYFKKFDFLEVLDDDGSTWNDFSETSTNVPYSKSFTVGNSDTTYLAANTADILTDAGGVALYTRIRNLALSGSVTIRLNEVATFTLNGGDDMIFELNDMAISKIEVKNITSGGVSTDIEIFCLVESPVNS